MVTFYPKHPKWDQNLQFTHQSETTSIPVTFIWESLRRIVYVGELGTWKNGRGIEVEG